MKYEANKGLRDKAVRIGCEKGLYQFIHDYADEIGMSASSAGRRLIMIGARCEAEHGKQTMPASYDGLRTGTKQLEKSAIAAEYTWNDEDDNVDKP